MVNRSKLKANSTAFLKELTRLASTLLAVWLASKGLPPI